MIKGVLIFAAGTAIGRITAHEPTPEQVASTEELKEAFIEVCRTFKHVLVDAWLDVKDENHKKSQTVDGDVIEETTPERCPICDALCDDGVCTAYRAHLDASVKDEPQQGEHPSE